MKEDSEKIKYVIFRLIIGSLLGLLGIICPLSSLGCIELVGAYLLLLYDITKRIFKLIFQRIIDDNLLILISSIGVFLLGQKVEGLVVLIIYQTGKLCEMIIIKKIKKVKENKINLVNRMDKDEVTKVNIDEIKVGDLLVIKKGETIPTDGIVIYGTSKLDVKRIMGSSLLQKVNINDKVLSGSINTDKIITIEVTNTYSNSMFNKSIELEKETISDSSKVHKKITKLIKIYTYIVILLTILITILFKFNIIFNEIYKVLTILAILYPTSIIFSYNLVYIYCIRMLKKEGILVTNGNSLKLISRVKNIIFDKRNIRSLNDINITKVNLFTKKYKKDEIIKYYVIGKMHSSYEVAPYIKKIGNNLINKKITNYKEYKDLGFSYNIGNKKIIVSSKIPVSIKTTKNASTVYMSINDKLVSSIITSECMNKNAKKSLSLINKMNMKSFILDNKDYNNNSSSRSLYVSSNYKKSNDRLTILMSNGEFNKNMIHNDIIILSDNLIRIPYTIKKIMKSKHILHENIIITIIIKLLLIALSLQGLLHLFGVILIDTMVTLFCIINILRINNK